MNSYTTERFWNAYENLPQEVKSKARKAYKLFSRNSEHPSLRFKKVHPEENIYAVRINRNYRALGVKKGEDVIWFWIGSHDDYERMISKL